MKRHLLLLALSTVVAGCSHMQARQSTTNSQAAHHNIKQTRTLGDFNRVSVQGPVHLDLHTGYKKPYVILSGEAATLAGVKTEVKNHTLFITVSGRQLPSGAVRADVRGHYLNAIDYKGSGDIRGKQLKTSLLDVKLANTGTTQLGGSIGLHHLEVTDSGFTQITGISSRDLDIKFKGNPKVQLTGQAAIHALDINGSGWLSMYWVKSDHLKVRAKKAAKIQLAGTVNRLEVELWGKSQFKGRYLRAQRSFVKTYGHSIAEISSVNHQSSLASNASDIYYYNLPGTRADFMADNGSVLDMRERHQDERKDYTRYNKQFP